MNPLAAAHNCPPYAGASDQGRSPLAFRWPWASERSKWTLGKKKKKKADAGRPDGGIERVIDDREAIKAEGTAVFMRRRARVRGRKPPMAGAKRCFVSTKKFRMATGKMQPHSRVGKGRRSFSSSRRNQAASSTNILVGENPPPTAIGTGGATKPGGHAPGVSAPRMITQNHCPADTPFHEFIAKTRHDIHSRGLFRDHGAVPTSPTRATGGAGGRPPRWE